MTEPLTKQVGFEPRNRRTPAPRRYAASLELMAGVALVVSTVVAAMVVSIGMARADTLAAVPAADHSLAPAVLLGFVLGGWGWLTVLTTRDVARRD